MNKRVCLAYYADGKWIGWYADSFGSCRKFPKIYGYTEPQMDIVRKNLRYKIKEINAESYKQNHEKFMEKQKNNELGPKESIHQVMKLALHDSENILAGKNVELKVVECPIYDGPNPDFSREAYTKDRLEYEALMKDAGIFDTPAPSKERTDAIREFETKHPRPIPDSWIYGDRDKIQEWANIEPSEFLETITV